MLIFSSKELSDVVYYLCLPNVRAIRKVCPWRCQTHWRDSCPSYVGERHKLSCCANTVWGAALAPSLFAQHVIHIYGVTHLEGLESMSVSAFHGYILLRIVEAVVRHKNIHQRVFWKIWHFTIRNTKPISLQLIYHSIN